MKKYKAKKSLGQNFLKSHLALRKIIEAGEVGKNDTVLEIGPGRGALTEKLLEKAGKVIAVEKDHELVEFLQKKFAKKISARSLVLIHGDILKFSPKDFNLKSGIYKLIANIPYNITGAILKKFLSGDEQPSMMVLMVQHEVAQRIVARSRKGGTSKESILSISVKAYGEPRMIAKVPARYFSPAPEVDSAIIVIKNISKNLFRREGVDEKKFWETVRAGFAHKRKILVGNLRIFDKKIDWNRVFREKSIKEKARAEDLTLKDWISLAKFTN
ncbi:ribosomal RNA small subunit methyltransferase A [Candidatus Nomurabacteria bacterium RIFCSPHIGHO2_01_FULL_40_20]|uniref:Ribosomal RNA small subunit methyltransferase A n=1 Tax=Candidatus Nomurabacteria bacterium RIFCSPHIGHO2_01_FULL_40_20 TaxID=1801738 RepID=A0A1F6V1H7_9BACT|nr:MAG: ribosomal RNA small subunit methyltransferase A [Candidatus Nomurabacteria bacterium RIFCSPHIGHO2_01_FULL_40_20]